MPKKRFTVMLNEETIQLIKNESTHWTPSGFRETIEDNLIAMVNTLREMRNYDK